MDVGEFIKILDREEGEDLEFKEGVSDKIAHVIVAFANTKGGIILLGVSDKKEIVGIKKKDLERLNSIIQNIKPKPRISIESLKIADKLVGVVRVWKGDKIYSYKNVAYVRVGSSNIPLSMEELAEKMFENLVLKFDEIISEGGIEDVDWDIVRRYIERKKIVRNVDMSKLPLKKVLEKIKALKDNKLTNAGLLFFSSNPQKYYPYARVRIMVFSGNDRSKVLEDLFIGGSVWDQALISLRESLKRIPKGFEVIKLERREEYAVDPEVLREAIVNAIIHRNYYTPSEIIIEIYSNRIRIINPGGFPPGVTPEDPIHKPRNPILSEYFFDVGLMEKYGRGIEMMVRICKEKGYPLPRYERTEGFTILTLEFRPVFLKRYKLSENELRVYSIIYKNPKSSSEIAKELGKSKYTALRILKRLEKLGLVKKIGTGKSTKYVAE